MPDARTIISGDPGSVFVNETDRPLYQIHAAGFNTCGLCWSYSEKIARYWPIPLHFNCRCRQTVVKPGQQASKPFINYETAIEALPPDQQNAVMGKSLFRLWREGVIDYKDAVTPARVRSLQEVTALKNLTVKQMVKAGVRPDIAQAAHAAVHTAEHKAVVAHRQQLLQKIAGAGVSHDQVVKHLAEKVASRATIAAGPTYTTKTGEVLPGIQAQQLINPAELRRRHAAELAAILGSGAAVNKAIAAVERAEKEKPVPVVPSGAVDDEAEAILTGQWRPPESLE